MAYDYNSNPDPFHNVSVIRRSSSTSTNKTILSLFVLTLAVFVLWYFWIQGARASVDPKYVYKPAEHTPDPIRRR